MKTIRLAILSLALAAPSFAQDSGPPPLDALFEGAIGRKDDAAIEGAFRERPFEVILLVDGYLEAWLSNVEGKAEGEAKVADPKTLLDKALDSAARADKALGGDGYTKYAKAWAGWTPEQQKQFRQGQAEYGAGRAAQKDKKLAEAKKHYENSLGLAAPLGDLWGEAQAHQSLGDVAMGEDRVDAAIEHFTKAKTIYASIRHQGGMRSMRALGVAHEKKGEHAAARKELEAMLKIAADAKLPRATGGPVLKDLARICAALGDAEAAKKYEAEAAAIEAAAPKKNG